LTIAITIVTDALKQKIWLLSNGCYSKFDFGALPTVAR